MKETIISTIWYSGGTSLRKQFPEALFMHVCPDAVRLNREGHPVITTYRDPYRVAASWYNRHGRWISPTWRKQWIDYKLLMPEKVYEMDELELHLNQFDDKNGLHAALDNEDMHYYHDLIPIEDIQFAEGPLHGNLV